MKKILLLLLIITSITSCVEDANNAICDLCNSDGPYRQFKIELRGQSSPDVQYPLNIIYFKNDFDGNLVSEIFSSVTVANVIEIRELYSSYKLGFKLNVGNGGQVPVNTVIITDLKTNQVIFENYNLSVATGQTFMYDIQSNTYTITN